MTFAEYAKQRGYRLTEDSDGWRVVEKSHGGKLYSMDISTQHDPDRDMWDTILDMWDTMLSDPNL